MWKRFMYKTQALFDAFFLGIFSAYIVVFSLYLVRTMKKKNLEKVKQKEEEKNIINFDQSG